MFDRLTYTRPRSGGGWLHRRLGDLWMTYRDWAAWRRSVTDLEALDARLLRDVGLKRTDRAERNPE